MQTEPTIQYRGFDIPFNSVKVYSSPLIQADHAHVRPLHRRLQWPKFWKLHPRTYTTLGPACYFVTNEVEALQVERAMPPISHIYNHVPMIYPFILVHDKWFDDLVHRIKMAKAGL